MSYYNQLEMFLKQARTGDLKFGHYQNEYLGTNVNVGFGQGYPTYVPWITFLIPPNKTRDGIYPVYLYYKEKEILILSYGVSETNEPRMRWNNANQQTIHDYFIHTYNQSPRKYGTSYVFKIYDVNNLPSKETIDKDLETIINEYKKLLFDKSDIEPKSIDAPKPKVTTNNDFTINSLIQSISYTGLLYSDKLITRFVASILTKPFVILTGLSGSGKTKLAQTFVQWICVDNSQYIIVPVGADWTNREPLLGYPNALEPEKYVAPDSGVLELMISAKKQPDLPYFLILDEMNLSQVERYFADFLSVMESGDEISLYDIGSDKNGVPPKINMPSNLFVIGTVNIDETTHMFSPKVLDRANTIEFRVTEDEMNQFLSGSRILDLDSLKGKGVDMSESFLRMSKDKSIADSDKELINTTLIAFFKELKKTGAEFGYRTATEIQLLMHHLSKLDNSLSPEEKIDIAIMQKLLPKLHGSRRKLSPILEKLASFCVIGETQVVKEIFDNPDFNFNGPNVRFPISLEKIYRMHQWAMDNGFASFAEA